MSRDFVGALLQLNAEKQVPQQALIRAVEEGIQAAYRRVAGEEDIFVRIEPGTGEIRVYRGRHVVDEVEDPLVEVTVDEAHQTHPEASAGEVIELEQLDAEHFGRIGAQTAKQIILQRMREVERDQRFDQLAAREGELITGTVSRVEPRAIILDVGKGDEAVLATSEQSPLEHYRIGQPVKAFVLEVRRSARGPQVMVSRTHKGFLRRLFELEVPEIHAGTVEIKAIAREAGSRSKVAVASRQDGLDPVGATVGQRGARVQAVVAELAGEKIDVIPWNEDASVFVANALSPGAGARREHRRGAPDRQRDGAGADAVAGHRPRGPERPARRAADRLADRHPERRGRRRGRRGTGRAGAATAATAAATQPKRRPTRARGRRGDGPPTAEAARPPSRGRRRGGRGRRSAPRRGARGSGPGARRGAPTKAKAAADAKRGRRPTAKASTNGDGRRRGGAEAADDAPAKRTPQGGTPRRCRRSRGAGRHGPAAAAARGSPTRSCVACRTARPKRDLVRVVRAPDGTIVARPDRPRCPVAAPTCAATPPAGSRPASEGAGPRAQGAGPARHPRGPRRRSRGPRGRHDTTHPGAIGAPNTATDEGGPHGPK